MPRFLIQPDSIKEGFVLLDKKETHHAVSVLRLKAGELVELFDGKGICYRGIVGSMKEGRLLVAIDAVQKEAAQDLKARVTLGISVIRPERMDYLIEKACELGVHTIAPLITERCVIRISKERWESKLKRWRKIAAESSKQCGRAVVPEIKATLLYEDFLPGVSSFDNILIATLAVPTGSLYASLKDSEPKNILILIGPEGDFSKREVELARAKGASPIGLGRLVMRSETAALYLISAVQFFLHETPTPEN
jgi:16S rRNA (uracil1498-N3)-methyltransferase